MKRLIAKIWVPALLVLMAAVQSFGIDAGRAAGLRKLTDSLLSSRAGDSSATGVVDSLLADLLRLDTLAADTLVIDTLATDTLLRDSILQDTVKVLTAKDTIVIPDSLKEKDPFFYKYYIAVKDSITRGAVRDSLIQAGDSLELAKLDSLYIKDSTEVAQAKFAIWYAGLSRKERKKYDAEQALPALLAASQRKLEIKDSIRAHKDSIIEATPRVLETFAFPDSMHYKRIVTWKHDRDYHNMVDLRDQWVDTSYNFNFYDYPFLKKDVGATWLGVAGSPAEVYNFFKRESNDDAKFFAPYQLWSFTTETLPNYNTKTPYTELAYWGTLFANKEKEESNIKILTTQNITPELNLTLQYTNFSGRGMLRREDISYRTLAMATNYTGKKYLMHAGYIYNRIEKSENGGLTDRSMIRDTTVDAREIEVYLKDAGSKLRTNTAYLDQSYRIPFNFIENLKGRKERMAEEARRDSILASGDSLAIEALKAKEEAELEAAMEDPQDTVKINKDITSAFIGHSTELAIFRRSYEDKIAGSDSYGREFFHDRFYLNPTTSKDSMRVMRLDNKAFIRLQPWKSDGIVSKLDVGIGDKLLNYYSFRPSDYLRGPENVVLNSVYVYAGANGQYDKYLKWDASGKYNFLGHEINDFNIKANVAVNIYPFRKDRKSPLALKAHFETSLTEPNYYDQHLYTNHFVWNNNFSKISTTKVEGSVAIPRWEMDASFGYALLSNNIYYDYEGIVRQNSDPMSIITATLRKDFTIWKFHLDNRVLFQYSSRPDVVTLPMLALNLRYYLQFDVVKNVMQMQIGANGLFTTAWYAPAYNPVVGVFHNQHERQYGNCPYIDAFVNVQWKRVSLFVKVVNVNMGWPCKKIDYFTADGYINTQRAIKFGISWPFWIFPGKKGASGASSEMGSAAGGRNSGPSGGRQRTTNR